MVKRIIIISDKKEIYCRNLELLDQSAEVYVAQDVQDGLSHLTTLSYHLILIFTQQELIFICQLVETIRNMVLTPIMVVLHQTLKERKLIIKTGADVVLEQSCGAEEIKLQAYALIRRYTTWEAKKMEEDSIVVGALDVNIFSRIVSWNQTQILLLPT